MVNTLIYSSFKQWISD